MKSPLPLVRTLLAWPVETQQGSRRNALVSSTALAQLRHERDEVEEFLQAHSGRAAPPATAEPQERRRDVI